jgi:hypothetical protein
MITKIALAVSCGFDPELAFSNVNEIRPGIRVLETSAKTGAGMEEWLAYLSSQRAATPAIWKSKWNVIAIARRRAWVLVSHSREIETAAAVSCERPDFYKSPGSYERVVLIREKVLLIAEATCCTPPTTARAIMVMSSAYSTRSWPSSRRIHSCILK